MRTAEHERIAFNYINRKICRKVGRNGNFFRQAVKAVDFKTFEETFRTVFRIVSLPCKPFHRVSNVFGNEESPDSTGQPAS